MGHQALFSYLLLLASLSTLILAETDETKWITTIDEETGDTIWLEDNRRPALYTGDYGDCLGGSEVNVTRFDAAYYRDNMTITFHLAGNTAIKNESLMMYIGVYAYGESRFDLTFDPCHANIASMCPLKEGVPIEATGIIPISQQDVAGIPDIALSIPDFEGEAILRIFSNSTESEIGCFSAIVTNGATFSHPTAVGTVLGVFALIAVISSFATTLYGDSIPMMRKHYAHSLSVLVVFAIFHHIFFTGALSMNWPSVLVAFWSNYAWSGGMIYSRKMQNVINEFLGINNRNLTSVGSAVANMLDEELGGGYDITKLYRRSIVDEQLANVQHHNVAPLYKRSLVDRSQGFMWYGNPVKPGIPLPGNFSGFAGTLAQVDIPVSNAFMTGFLWFLVLLGIIVATVALLKAIVEMLLLIRFIRNDRLTYFRSHWISYTAHALLRTCYIGFFMITFLSLFQFTYSSGPGVIAVAVFAFLIFSIGTLALVCYAYYYRIHYGKYKFQSDRIMICQAMLFGILPWFSFVRVSSTTDIEPKKSIVSITSWVLYPPEEPVEDSAHADEGYTKKFGWLFSRYRRTRWWFFGPWLIYEFIRACFYGGASGSPMVQIFGLLVIECLAFAAMIRLRPFEGQRLNVLMVYLLGFSKVATLALSAAFDVRFNNTRIITTVIGIVIIVIQGVLTIILVVAIAVGAVSTHMSITRHRESIRPKRFIPIREKYFKHMDRTVLDVPRPPPPPKPEPEPVPTPPREPYFSVGSVRRIPKIEDEESEIGRSQRNSRISLGRIEGIGVPGTRQSWAPSINSQFSSSNNNIAYAALPSRAMRSNSNSRELNEQLQRDYRRTSSPPIYEQGFADSVSVMNVIGSKPVSPSPSPAPLRPATVSPNRSPAPLRSTTPLGESSRGRRASAQALLPAVEDDEISNFQNSTVMGRR